MRDCESIILYVQLNEYFSWNSFYHAINWIDLHKKMYLKA